MITKSDKNKARLKRHLRVRKKIEGTTATSTFEHFPFFQTYVCSTYR